jgi:hypothetical protein
MKLRQESKKLLAAFALVLATSECRQKTEESTATLSKTAVATHTATGRNATLLAQHAGPAFAGNEVSYEKMTPCYVAPKAKETGLLPNVWAGRSAQEEEARLRANDLWREKKLAFFREWAEVDPKAAIEAARNTDRDSITVCTVAALQGWYKNDPSTARAWVDTQPENAERTTYVHSILASEAPEVVDAVAWEQRGQWLSGQLSLPGIYAVISEQVSQWSVIDREGAVQWMEAELAESIHRQQIVDQWMVGQFSTDERFADTTQWLQNYAQGEMRDAFLLSYVKQVVNADAAVAKQWADLIQDEKLREHASALCEENANAPEKE